MPKTQRLIVACLVLAAGLGIGFIFSKLLVFQGQVSIESDPVQVVSQENNQELYEAMKRVLEENGVVVDGLSPYSILENFPAVEEVDFSGVEAVVGRYEFSEGQLTYDGDEAVGTVAASDISMAGFSLFLKNYSDRTGVPITVSSSAEVVEHMLGPSTPLDLNSETTDDIEPATQEDVSDEYVACTLDAKECPDGSYVGRIPPDCAFAECAAPVVTAPKITCSSTQKEAMMCAEIYQPVCASVQIQCVTTPCEPILKTFSNSCEACSEHSVTEYTEGECSS